MNLRYKCFGKVATLIRYRRLAVEGERVTVECPDTVKCRIYSEKEKRAYTFEGDGIFDIPAQLLSGGVSVSFENSYGESAMGTPLTLQRVGETLYVVGGALSQREEIERLNDALVYAVTVAEKAQAEAARVGELEKRLAALEARANSGDIINF